MRTIVRELISSPVAVRDADGRQRHVPAMEAILRVARNKALKGDSKATTEVLKLAREFEADADAAGDTKKVDPADLAVLKDHQALQALLNEVSSDE